MPIKVTNNFPKFKNQVERKAAQFVLDVASVGAKWSRFWAPIEYSNLVNSQRINTRTKGASTLTGTLSFGGILGVDYALELEKNKNWKPRPIDQKEGPAWNPRAKPGFLKAGFEDPEPQREIQNLKQKVFKL